MSAIDGDCLSSMDPSTTESMLATYVATQMCNPFCTASALPGRGTTRAGDESGRSHPPGDVDARRADEACDRGHTIAGPSLAEDHGCPLTVQLF